MKYHRVAVTALGICALVALGCKGPKGDTGNTGPAGAQGSQGQQGTSGNLSILPAPGTVIFSLGGADFRYANPDSGALYSYDLSTGALTRLGYTGIIETNALAVSPTTKIAYVGQGVAMGGKMLKVDLTTGEIRPLIAKFSRAGVTGLAFSPNGQLLAAGINAAQALPTLFVLDPNTGETFSPLSLSGLVFGMGFSPDGTLLSFGNSDGRLKSVNLTTGAVTAVPGVPVCGVARALAFRSSTEIISGQGAIGSTPHYPVLYRLNMTTGLCTPITLTTFTTPPNSISGMGVAIAP